MDRMNSLRTAIEPFERLVLKEIDANEQVETNKCRRLQHVIEMGSEVRW